MMYWIIKENLHDKEFIEKRTKGFEDLKKTVEKYADAEKITGVPTEKVKEMARKYAAAKNAVIIYCLGITELTTGTDNVGRLGTLDALRNIGRPGVVSTRFVARTTCRCLRHGCLPECLLGVPEV